MLGAHPVIATAGYWEAGAVFAASALAAFCVRWALNHAGVLAQDRVDAVLATRFRVIQRLAVAAVLIVGVLLAISQVAELNRLATSLLASSAIIAAVVGLASRQVLGNALAGVQLAVAQPVRIGDTIAIGDHAGVVEDIRLTSTSIRTPANQRVIVPNEQMISGIVRNDTIVSPEVAVEVSLWLPAHADAQQAAQVLGDVVGAEGGVRLADMSPEGAVRVVVSRPPVAPAARVAAEGALRAESLAALRGAGLLIASG